MNATNQSELALLLKDGENLILKGAELGMEAYQRGESPLPCIEGLARIAMVLLTATEMLTSHVDELERAILTRAYTSSDATTRPHRGWWQRLKWKE